MRSSLRFVFPPELDLIILTHCCCSIHPVHTSTRRDNRSTANTQTSPRTRSRIAVLIATNLEFPLYRNRDLVSSKIETRSRPTRWKRNETAPRFHRVGRDRRTRWKHSDITVFCHTRRPRDRPMSNIAIYGPVTRHRIQAVSAPCAEVAVWWLPLGKTPAKRSEKRLKKRSKSARKSVGQ